MRNGFKGAAAVLTFGLLHANAVTYDITTSSGLFEPIFRGGSNATWFAWNEGQFFGQPVPASTSRILNNPATSNGTAGLAGVEFYQNDRSSGNFTMIGSSGGNIYTGLVVGQSAIGKEAAAILVAPIALGGPDGFTTIVIQGRTTAAGGPSTIQTLTSNYPVFSDINGVSPEFVISGNAAKQGQWWAQYEIPGYAPSYTIGITFPGGNGTTPISIAGMSVDTFWSASGFADVQAIPEPGAWTLLAFGLMGLWGFGFFKRKRA